MEQILPTAAASAATSAAPRRRVKDAPSRALHWWMALCFAIAYVTGDSESWRLLHVVSGYSLMLALALRVLLGLFGPQPLRPALWLRRGQGGLQWLWAQRKPAAWQQWLAQPVQQAQQTITQVAALAMVALPLCLPAVGLTGYITYNELTGDWMSDLHEWFGNLVLAAVLLHVGLLTLGSLLRRQNLLQPMLSGTMPGKGVDLMPRNRLWLALLLSACLAGFAGAYWQQARQDAGAQPAGLALKAEASAGHDD